MLKIKINYTVGYFYCYVKISSGEEYQKIKKIKAQGIKIERVTIVVYFKVKKQLP
jgi:hypothetical protein